MRRSAKTATPKRGRTIRGTEKHTGLPVGGWIRPPGEKLQRAWGDGQVHRRGPSRPGARLSESRGIPDDTSRLMAEEYAKLPAPGTSQIERFFNLTLQSGRWIADQKAAATPVRTPAARALTG